MLGSKDTSPVGDLENSGKTEEEQGSDDNQDDKDAVSRAQVTYLDEKKMNIEENRCLLKHISEYLQLTTKPRSSFETWDVDAITQEASVAFTAIKA